MIKYLTAEQLNANLQLGKPVEQWLLPGKQEDYIVLKWLRIDIDKYLKYNLTYFECFDEGNKDFLDIYEFSPVEPDRLFGVGNTFDSIDDALNFATITYSASIQKFISAGIIQDEYLNYINTKIEN